MHWLETWSWATSWRESWLYRASILLKESDRIYPPRWWRRDLSLCVHVWVADPVVYKPWWISCFTSVLIDLTTCLPIPGSYMLVCFCRFKYWCYLLVKLPVNSFLPKAACRRRYVYTGFLLACINLVLFSLVTSPVLPTSSSMAKRRVQRAKLKRIRPKRKVSLKVWKNRL